MTKTTRGHELVEEGAHVADLSAVADELVEAAAQSDADPAPTVVDPGDAPTPCFYRVLPWSGRTLEQQLNAAAADGWRITATVDVYIIMERR